jgi:spore germination protein GerM
MTTPVISRRPARVVPHSVVRALVVAALVGVGLWARAAATTGPELRLDEWLPWLRPAPVTLYFVDEASGYLVPVSRPMPKREDLPRAALEALIAGPAGDSRLVNPIPAGTRVLSTDLAGGLARVDLSAEFLRGDAAAQNAIIETLTALPGVQAAALSVEGQALGSATPRLPLIYFASTGRLVALPTQADSPRAALADYLEGPPTAGLTGLPADVQLLDYEFDAANGLLSLDFTYTPSVRALAVNQADTMRRVLVGLVASLTEFREVQAVRLDFEGRARLGLGQCSDLLRAPQLRPPVLNDERLLGR